MENKYYTPEIEEFNVGFECEIETSWGYSKGEWPDILKKDTLTGFEKDIMKATRMAGFRVKCLDSSDIESLGFKLDPIRSYINHRNCFSLLINELYGLSLDHIYNENKIILRGHKVDYPTKTLFEGSIRNLSELKKLLKQTKNYE